MSGIYTLQSGRAVLAFVQSDLLRRQPQAQSTRDERCGAFDTTLRLDRALERSALHLGQRSFRSKTNILNTPVDVLAISRRPNQQSGRIPCTSVPFPGVLDRRDPRGSDSIRSTALNSAAPKPLPDGKQLRGRSVLQANTPRVSFRFPRMSAFSWTLSSR